MDTVEYIELFWDCPECGQAHISAVFNPQGNRCPSCLTWRLESIALYEAPDSQVITDPKLINRPPFWVCKVCDAVNADTGLAPKLLQCENCNSYQTSEIGAISGNSIPDQQAPPTVPVGTPVKLQKASSPKSPPRPARSANGAIAAVGVSTVAVMGMGIMAGTIWSGSLPQSPIPAAIAPPVSIPASIPTSPPLQVQVMDLNWVAEVDIEEQQGYTQESWKSAMPPGATLIKSETRKNQRSEQRGFRTTMVPEQYQSGTTTETYTEPEQYQSGTTTKTDYSSERYQSGTTNETYYESERYQSGTEQKCETRSMGNGVGQRSCTSVPVYSTRQVSRSRSVPTYSTRQVPQTQTIPVYSTRQVKRTRSIPVYSTRQIPVKEPIVMMVPFDDTWATYRLTKWTFKQTQTVKGKRDAPRQPNVKLVKLPPQQIAATRMKCQLTGRFKDPDRAFGQSAAQVGVWNLPCDAYDRVNIGDRVQLRPDGVDSANLVSVP
jgi:hypothetical protein